MRTTETVVILTATTVGTDSTNQPIPGPDAETPYECVVWPSSSKDDLEVGLLGTVEEWVVSFPYGTSIAADARARIRGKVFHAVVDGFDWANPHTGRRPGTTVTFRRAGTGG